MIARQEIEHVGSVEDIPEVTAVMASSRPAGSKQAPFASVVDVPSSHGKDCFCLLGVLDTQVFFTHATVAASQSIGRCFKEWIKPVQSIGTDTQAYVCSMCSSVSFF